MSGWTGQPSDLTSLLTDPALRTQNSGLPFGLSAPSITAANVTPADAAEFNRQALDNTAGAYIQRQRDEAARQGLWDDSTGMPTGRGLINAAQQYGQGMLLGTEAPGGIRAYHGSPFSFDRFDASKIGTGEGQQVFGHGLYFAEAPGVAETCRDMPHPAVGRDARNRITDDAGMFAEVAD